MDNVKIEIDLQDNGATASVKQLREYLDEMRGSVSDVTDELRVARGALKETQDAIKELNNTRAKSKEEAQEQVRVLAELTKQEAEQKQKVSELSQVFKTQIKDITAADGSYDQLNATLGRMRDTYRQLSETERKGEFGETLLKNIQVVDKELKRIDATMGNHQRNVGNYEEAFSNVAKTASGVRSGFLGVAQAVNILGLQGTELETVLSKIQLGLLVVQQVAKSVPSVISSSATAFKALKSASLAFTNSLKVTTISLKTFTAALAATGIGAVVVTLGVVAANWDKIKNALSGVTKAQQAFRDAQLSSLDKTKESVQTIRTYTNYLQSGNLTLAQRKTALKELAKAMGDTVDITKDYYAEESRILANAGPYIKMQIKKAQAELLIAKNAELSYKQQKRVLDLGNVTDSWWYKMLPNALQMLVTAGKLAKVASDTKDIEKEMADNEETIKKLLSDIGSLNGQINITTGEENRLLEKQKRLREQIRTIVYNPDDDEQFKKLEQNYDKDAAKLKEALNIKAITQEEYDTRILDLQAKFNDDIVDLVFQRHKEEQDKDKAAFDKKLAQKQAEQEALLEMEKNSATLEFDAVNDDPNSTEVQKLQAQIALNKQLYELEQQRIAQEIEAREAELENAYLTADERARIEQEITRLRADEINKRLSYEQKDANDSKKLAQERAKYALNTAQVTLNATAGLFDALSNFYEEGSEEQKKFQIASVVVSTLAGVAQAIASAWSLGPILGAIVGSINAATTLATGVAQIQKIKSGSEDLSGGSAVAATPATGQLLDSGIFASQLGTDTELDLQAAKNTRVYVLESDISDAQDAVKTRVDESEF